MKINFVDILLILLLLMCFVVALFFVSGCATTKIEVTKPDGTVIIKGEATAILGAEQKGINVTKDGEDWLFEMEQQRSEADLFLLGVEYGKRMMVP